MGGGHRRGGRRAGGRCTDLRRRADRRELGGTVLRPAVLHRLFRVDHQHHIHVHDHIADHQIDEHDHHDHGVDHHGVDHHDHDPVAG
ncbi:hypothetical protein EXE63_16185 [Mycolicibacterium frederiksbergense]|uniref:Uncharacterized protein n=1 Tax=Mycolicibacterium frederiksbergense TaxID=117567 RepID=A0A6H0S4H1_9MYCO|nr:hypothetical protein EXE63_16185 [Mycolicibacterium frederiksbergense]